MLARRKLRPPKLASIAKNAKAGHRGRLFLFLSLPFLAASPGKAGREQEIERTVIQPPLAPGAQTPARVEVEKPLHDFLLAADAKSERLVPQPDKCPSQGIELRVALEGKERLKLTVGNPPVPEDFPWPLQVIYLSQMLKKVRKNDEPHGTFTSLHVVFLPLSATYI